VSDRLYCHVGDLVEDLSFGNPLGDISFLGRIRSASDWLEGKNGLRGYFIPVTETKRFDGPKDRRILFVPPVLAVTGIVDDTTTLATSDYLLYPRDRHWLNGPYSRIEIDPDAASLTAWTYERDVIVVAGRWGKYEETAATGATLGADLTAGATTVTVSDATVIFPGMTLSIDTEQTLVTGVSDFAGRVFTLKRGTNGTTAAAHTSGATINQYLPPGDVRYLCRQIAVLMHKKAKSGYAGKTGAPDTGEVFYHKEFPRDVVDEVRKNYAIASL